MLRAALIIAIVAGLAAAGLNFYQVQNVLKAAIAERDDQNTKRQAAETELASTKTKLKKTEGDLAATKKTLSDTQASLTKETARANDEEKQNKDLTAKLATTEADRDKAQRELESWAQLKVTPSEVKKLIVDFKNEKEKNAVAQDENKILMNRYTKLKAEYERFIGKDDETPPALPTGLKGSVIAVDPKYDFVVLNIGGDQGVLERGEMLVNHNGKLVAKVKIFSVEQNRCIANIMPKWKQGQVMEGDQVMY